MAVVFEGAGSYASGSSVASCSMPASVAEGDLLILIAEAGAQIPSVPSGWTSIGSGQTGGPSEYARTRVCYKIAGASESNVSVSGGNEGVRGIVLRFTGHDPTTPIAYTNGGADSGNLSANTFTTTVANVMVVCALGFYDADAADTSNWGSWACASLESITEGHDQSDDDGYGGGVAFAYGVKASAGAVGSVTATADTSGLIYYVTFGIAPLSAQTLTLSGIASGAAIGTPTIVKGNVNLALSGIASALALGTATIVPGNVNLAPTGITSTVQIGTVTITSTEPTLTLTGIASTVQVGTPTMVPGPISLVLTGIASGAQIGSIALAPGKVNLELAGIASGAQIGEVSFGTNFILALSGIASTVAFGTLALLVPVPPVYESLLVDCVERSLELGLTERSLHIDSTERELELGLAERSLEIGSQERLLILGVINVPVIGDTIRLTGQFKNWAGALADPTSIEVKTYDQNRNLLATISGASVVKSETGKYYAEYVVPDVKMLIYEYSGTLETKTILQRKTLNPVWLGG